MRKYGVVLVLGAALAGAGCESGREDSAIVEEVRDLREAQQNAPREAEELQRELVEAERRVVELQEQLAMARAGVTEDVQRERAELEADLNEQEREINEDVREAQRRAVAHNREAELAQRELRRGQAIERVEGHVESDVDIQTQQPEVDERRVERSIEVERTDLPAEG